MPTAVAPPSSTSTAIKLVLIIVAALGLFALVTYYNRNKAGAPAERYTERHANVNGARERFSTPSAAPLVSSSPAATAAAFAPAGVEPMTNEAYRVVQPADGAAAPKDPFPQDRIAPTDLLPKDAANTKWAQVNPAGQGDVQNINFLTAGHHVGVNTQGQSLRNASHDLRSEPSNPRYKVSVWQQSTIQPDLNRRPLE